MLSIDTVILYLTMLTVAINGQKTPLTITSDMTAECSTRPTCDAANLNTDAFDSKIGTCAAFQGTAVTMTIDLKKAYTINSITITVKTPISLDTPTVSFSTTATSGLNAASGNNGMAVAISTTSTGPGTACTPVPPATAAAPFVAAGANWAATYNCNNVAGQYFILTGAGAGAANTVAVCLFSVMLQDTTTTSTTTATTTATTTTTVRPGGVTTATVAKSSRYVRFDWSIMIAMLLAAVKVTMDSGRHY